MIDENGKIELKIVLAKACLFPLQIRHCSNWRQMLIASSKQYIFYYLGWVIEFIFYTFVQEIRKELCFIYAFKQSNSIQHLIIVLYYAVCIILWLASIYYTLYSGSNGGVWPSLWRCRSCFLGFTGQGDLFVGCLTTNGSCCVFSCL